MAIERYSLPYSEDAEKDLRERVARARWPHEVPGSEWDYGVNCDYLKKLSAYWKDTFSWREQVEKLSGFKHYSFTSASGRIHFIHERGKGINPLPLVLTHGWPGSFLEMLKVIPMLTDPERFGADPRDAFDVIVPSLPGYGFSEAPIERGMNTFRIAELWTALLSELGYERFAAQGGDWGAYVTTVLGLRHPNRVIGMHLNYIPPYPVAGDNAGLSEAEQAFFSEVNRWDEERGAYNHVQKNEPQTLAYGLSDSPIGLAAWLIDKFRRWSDGDGDLERTFTKDDLLANITLYWMTETIGSSIRLYYEDRCAPLYFGEGDYVRVPCGIAHFPKEAPFPPRRWVERRYNIQHWSDMPKGGHFAALEQPELFVEDLRSFFRALRSV